MAAKNKAKVYRDPVHDIISYKDEPVLGPIVARLIDAREMQRLRHIRQLGLASLVFHGAEHSRFAHSMGVGHIARRMVDRVAGDLHDEERLIVLAAALLHDVGHAPFSHVMERVFGFDHEEYSAAIVLDPESEVYRVLTEVDRTLPDEIAARLTKRVKHFSTAIVSSQLDADRADYLLRDAHMTGVEVGRYDLERILLMLDHDETGLLVREGAYESVEGYLIARYHMYRLVYFHRAVRAAEVMLIQLFRRARALMEDGDDTLAPNNAFGKLMRKQHVSIPEWSRLGDFHAWALISTWCEHPDSILSGLATGLMTRRLFKSIERDVSSPAEETREAERLLAIREGLAPNERYLFAVDEASDVPYRPYLPDPEAAHRAIRIIGRDGKVFHIEQRSPIVRALADASYRLRRWYFHPMLKKKVLRLGEV